MQVYMKLGFPNSGAKRTAWFPEHYMLAYVSSLSSPAAVSIILIKNSGRDVIILIFLDYKYR